MSSTASTLAYCQDDGHPPQMIFLESLEPFDMAGLFFCWAPHPFSRWVLLLTCDIFGLILWCRKEIVTLGMFFLWSLWMLVDANLHMLGLCSVCFPLAKQIWRCSQWLFFWFVSAAWMAPQIPHPCAPALLDIQGMEPIAQVCLATVAKIQDCAGKMFFWFNHWSSVS